MELTTLTAGIAAALDKILGSVAIAPSTKGAAKKGVFRGLILESSDFEGGEGVYIAGASGGAIYQQITAFRLDLTFQAAHNKPNPYAPFAAEIEGAKEAIRGIEDSPELRDKGLVQAFVDRIENIELSDSETESQTIALSVFFVVRHRGNS